MITIKIHSSGGNLNNVSEFIDFIKDINDVEEIHVISDTSPSIMKHNK